MSHASDIRYIDIDVIYIVDDELRRIRDFDAMSFDDEESFSSDAGIKAAELHDNQLAGDASFYVKLKEVLHV